MASLTLAAAIPTQASAADANWKTVQYRPYQQVSIECGAVLLCEIAFQPGEHIHGSAGSLVRLWDYNMVYEGDGASTPHLILKPVQAGLRENVIISTNRHMYRLYLTSTNSQTPTYVRFVYDDETREREHHLDRMRQIDADRARARQRFHPIRNVARPPVTTLEQACASMPQPGWRMDREPDAYRPRQVCESMNHTFIGMPFTPTETTDLPVPLMLGADGDRPVNYRYDVRDRVFVIDGTASEYVLVVGSGRRSIRMRVQRIESTHRGRK